MGAKVGDPVGLLVGFEVGLGVGILVGRKVVGSEPVRRVGEFVGLLVGSSSHTQSFNGTKAPAVLLVLRKALARVAGHQS